MKSSLVSVLLSSALPFVLATCATDESRRPPGAENGGAGDQSEPPSAGRRVPIDSSESGVSGRHGGELVEGGGAGGRSDAPLGGSPDGAGGRAAGNGGASDAGAAGDGVDVVSAVREHIRAVCENGCGASAGGSAEGAAECTSMWEGFLAQSSCAEMHASYLRCASALAPADLSCVDGIYARPMVFCVREAALALECDQGADPARKVLFEAGCRASCERMASLDCPGAGGTGGAPASGPPSSAAASSGPTHSAADELEACVITCVVFANGDTPDACVDERNAQRFCEAEAANWECVDGAPRRSPTCDLVEQRYWACTAGI